MNTCPICPNDLVCHDQGECLRPTPETDAIRLRQEGLLCGEANLQWAEKLERERNEARELLASEKATRNAIIAKGIETERQLAMTPDTPPSPMKTIEQFCDKHNACPEGREWALANCEDMQEVWQTAKPEWLLWIAIRPSVLTEKELRLFAVFCARSVEHLLTDDRSRNAIAVAERFANGQATVEELAAARSAAWDAARAASAASAARAAAWAAAWATALATAWDAAWDAGRATAWDAARDAREAAWATAWDAQAAWLRDNTKPSFE